MANILAIKAELTAGHPVTGPYNPDAVLAAAQINAENIDRNVVSVTGQDIFEATTAADLSALSAAQKAVYFAIVGMGTILVNGTNTKAALLSMFGTDTDTRANLAALQTEKISQVTDLELGVVKASHIQQARAS